MGKKWQADNEHMAKESRKAIAELRSEAIRTGSAEEASKLFTADAIRTVARAFPKRTAIGADCLDFTIVGALPHLILSDLAKVLKKLVTDCTWQHEQLESWMCLLPKRLGGYRTIAIMTSVARICMKILCTSVRSWDKLASSPGDTAAPGVQPLVAVAARAANAEAATLVGRKVLRILWDVEQLFDSIPIPRLIEDVRRHGFPLAAAAMALQLHTADRRLRIGAGHGPLVCNIGRSILAGCSSSTSLARVFLIDPVATQDGSSHEADTGVHVDDVSQSFYGNTEPEVLDEASALGTRFANMVQEKGLRISDKSFVVASSVSLARKLRARLAAAGLAVRVETHGEDLGVGTRPGRRTATAIKRRLALGLNRAGRSNLLRRAAGSKANKMFATGIRPQSIYGHSCGGLSRSHKSLYLRSATIAAGKSGFQPCPLSLVKCRLGLLPLVHLQVEQIRTWIQLWQQATSALRASYTKAWRVARDKLQRTRSWSQVHGPIGATILTLIENGWVPAQPTLWVDRESEQFATLEAQEPHAMHDILQAFELSITKRAWRRAAAHYKSAGLERGVPSFEPAVQARKVLSKMAAQHATLPTDTERPFLPASERMAALNAVNSGGSNARFRPPKPCP